jgi:acetylornithine/succinyldiaminopimelate/putrescine aminotransferase
MIKRNIIYNDYSDWSFDVSKAKGDFVWDKSGKRMIDFTSGWNVTNLGWNHPEITQAIIDQARKNTYAAMWTADEIQNEYAKVLTQSLPKGLDAVGRATGGTEANEEAIKTARSYTGRKKIIGFKNTYHGQSFGTIAIGFLPEYVESFSPLVGGFVQMDYPKLFGSNKDPNEILSDFGKKLEKFLAKKDVAAIVTEAGIITGWGSTYVAPKGFLTLVRKLTKKYGTMMILDEVGTGFSRCGKLYGMEIENVVPDIATFAKGLSNGAAAIGAMVTMTEIAEKTYKKSNLTSTFGWTPIACAVALKTLQIHKRDKIWQKAQKDGKYLMDTLKKEFDGVKGVADVRGIGMEVGVSVTKDGVVGKIVRKAREKGLHIVSDNERNIQLMPPLTIKQNNLDNGISILVNLIKDL